MEWHQLLYFRELARQQHFTSAAERLSLSQPALSRSIARLEQELGIPLFDRKGRTVRLNRYGKAFLQHVDRTLAEMDEARHELSDLVGPVQGTVAIGFIHLLAARLLPVLLRRFKREHPAVEFTLSQGGTASLLEKLIAGDTDLCLLATHPTRPDLRWVPLFEEEIFAAVPPEHRLASRESIQLVELAGEPFITFLPGWGLRQLNEDLCRQAGFVPRVAFEGEEVSTVHGLVAAGLGVALIPRTDAPREARAAWLRLSAPQCKRAIGVAWIDGRYLPAVARLFRDYVVESFQNPGRRLSASLAAMGAAITCPDTPPASAGGFSRS